MSRPTRVLVTGAQGQVGVDLLDVLNASVPLGADEYFVPDGTAVQPEEFQVVGLSHHDLDITDEQAVKRAISTAKPDVIVHLAAYTAVDKAETDRDTCFAVNEMGTKFLSEAARENGSHLIAVSTDYVFDGDKGSPYNEEDEVNPLSVYGASKMAGELMCSASDTIVRTSWVMGVRGKNVVHVIAERAKSGQTVKFVNDQTGTVTGSADLAQALVPLIRQRPGGVWHVANSGTTTWFEIAHYVGELLGRGEDFATPITTKELDPQPLAHRPTRSDLDTTKYQTQFGPLAQWREVVSRLVRDRELLLKETP